MTSSGHSPSVAEGADSAARPSGKLTAAIAQDFLHWEARVPSDHQRLFLLFFTGTLIDLVVLGLFAEYSDKVYVDSFTTTLLAAIVLQVLLKATIWAEHRILARFKDKTGVAWKTGKYFTAWLILFGSKFVILEALSFVFAKDLHFEGVLHGLVWLIIVVVTMVVAEELVVRLYRKLG